jgi:hypothetical protein
LWVGAQFALSRMVKTSSLEMGWSLYWAGKTARRFFMVSEIIFFNLAREDSKSLFDKKQF